jgi:hypothetical protein
MAAQHDHEHAACGPATRATQQIFSTARPTTPALRCGCRVFSAELVQEGRLLAMVALTAAPGHRPAGKIEVEFWEYVCCLRQPGREARPDTMAGPSGAGEQASHFAGSRPEVP